MARPTLTTRKHDNSAGAPHSGGGGGGGGGIIRRAIGKVLGGDKTTGGYTTDENGKITYTPEAASHGFVDTVFNGGATGDLADAHNFQAIGQQMQAQQARENALALEAARAKADFDNQKALKEYEVGTAGPAWLKTEQGANDIRDAAALRQNAAVQDQNYQQAVRIGGLNQEQGLNWLNTENTAFGQRNDMGYRQAQDNQQWQNDENSARIGRSLGETNRPRAIAAGEQFQGQQAKINMRKSMYTPGPGNTSFDFSDPSNPSIINVNPPQTKRYDASGNPLPDIGEIPGRYDMNGMPLPVGKTPAGFGASPSFGSSNGTMLNQAPLPQSDNSFTGGYDDPYTSVPQQLSPNSSMILSNPRPIPRNNVPLLPYTTPALRRPVYKNVY